MLPRQPPPGNRTLLSGNRPQGVAQVLLVVEVDGDEVVARDLEREVLEVVRDDRELSEPGIELLPDAQWPARTFKLAEG